MYSIYKLNKQGDNIQPWRTPFPIVPCFLVVPCPVLPVASWPAYRFLRRQVRWSVVLSLSEFSTVYCDPHSQRLSCSQWSRSRCFSGNSLAFSMIQWMLAIWSLVPLPFLNPAWASGSSHTVEAWLGEFWALLVSMWDACRPAVVCTLLGAAFLWKTGNIVTHHEWDSSQESNATSIFQSQSM